MTDLPAHDHRSSPGADELIGLDADRWALLLPHLRAVLVSLSAERLGPRGARLLEAPTGRLAGGRGRRELCEFVVVEEVWAAVCDRLAADTAAAPHFEAILGGTLADRRDRADEPGTPARQRVRDRERLRAMREERDAFRRRADGAEVRVQAMARELAAAQEELDTLRGRIEELETEMGRADEVRERAVDRERRRQDGRVAELAEQLASLRRTEEERREEERRRATARAQQTAEVERQAAVQDRTGPGAVTRLVPGRPSRLPEGMEPGTTEAVQAYLHRSRRVLVDGYNVTLQHRSGLTLERQRAWLVETLANLARQRGVRPTIVFDGEAGGVRHLAAAGREVAVRFSGAGISADDEIVLELESTDEPIVVVTDDRELIERCRSCGADVLHTYELLWVLP